MGRSPGLSGRWDGSRTLTDKNPEKWNLGLVFDSTDQEESLSADSLGLFTSWRVLSRQGEVVQTAAKTSRRQWLWRTLYIYAITLIILALISVSFGIDVKLFSLLTSDSVWAVCVGIAILALVLWRGVRVLVRETIPTYLGRQKLGMLEITGETIRIVSSHNRTLFSNRLSPELRTEIQADSSNEGNIRLYLYEGEDEGVTTALVLCAHRTPELLEQLQKRGEGHSAEAKGRLFTGHSLDVGEAHMVQMMDSIFQRIEPSSVASE